MSPPSPFNKPAQTISVHVNGNFCGQIPTSEATDRKTALEIAFSDAIIQPFLLGKNILRTALLPGKIFNITVK